MTALDRSAPAEIGACTVLETVEARAFTVTYRAEQRSLGRTVLVKTLKPTVAMDSPHAAELAREASILGRLEDPSIPRLFDFVRTGVTEWMVFEDARCVPLDDVLAAAHLGVDQAVAIALQVARAVGHAHAHGIVHRSLRSAIVGIGVGGRVLVSDFSTAVELAPAEGEDRAHDDGPQDPVELGAPFARPNSMAPEQILGDPSGPRSDVWAIGVLLYQLVSGNHPFDTGDPRAVAPRIRGVAPAPLPSFVPSSVERLVSRCLSKSPQDRYEDARAVTRALEEALSSISRLPLQVLASHALLAARLGDALPFPGGMGTEGRPADTTKAPSAVPLAARNLAAILALILAGGASIQALVDEDNEPGATGAALAPGMDSDPRGALRGMLRVVVTPWAEVLVDGELVDVTPIGRPIKVSAGKHFVTFRHPNAPDEQRTIKVIPGQIVFLDVAMRVDRGDAGRGTDSGVVPDPSP